MVFLIQIKEKKMKKNFLKIAALLIAAMLLVVSCAPEATVKNESNLVEVNLSTSVASKSLTFGDTLASTNDLTYRYYLTALWDKNSVNEEVVGETAGNGVEFSIRENGVNLGYLSQGYWKITVKGFNSNDEVVLYGETNHYVTKGKGDVTVFLNTSGDDNSTSTLHFEINVNDLAEGNDGYDLYYSITGKNYKGVDVGVEETKFSTKTALMNGQANKYVTKFTDDVANLKPGYYRVTVTLKKNETDVIGGITRGFLLVNGDTEVKLSGSVSASDFVKSTLNVYTPEVKFSSVSAKVSGSEDNLLRKDGEIYKGKTSGASEENKVTVTYSVDSSFSINGQTSGVKSVSGPTYSWMVNGKEVGTAQTYETSYAPGHKDVTCIVTYNYTCKVGESETVFAVSNEACTYLLVKGN